MEYAERLQKLDLTTLAFRRERSDMIELYKICHKLYDRQVTPKLNFSHQVQDKVLRGHKYKLNKPFIKNRFRQNSFLIRTINVWNSLPKDIAEAPTLNCFKARRDRQWKSQDAKYNHKAKIKI